jgi:hypothetical protein
MTLRGGGGGDIYRNMKPSGSKSLFPREELLSFLQDFDDGYPWPSWE